MKVNCYYCDYNNFGDQLNKYIFQNSADIKIRWSKFDRATMIGIGSILDACVDSKRNKKNNKQLYCFSSGFACAEQIVSLCPEKNKLTRPVKYLAIRGEKTKNLLIDAGLMERGSNPVLADGGLLASDLLKEKIVKKYEVGIVGHAQEIRNPIFKKLNQSIPNSVMINIQEEPLKFIKELASCETIISSAMHPLIVADSLNIPNQWIRLPEKYCATNRFKFDDYYSCYGLEKNPLNVNCINADVKQKIICSYNISKEEVMKKQKELKNALDELKSELNSKCRNIEIDYYKNIIYMYFVFYPKKYFVEYPIRAYKKARRILHTLK